MVYSGDVGANNNYDCMWSVDVTAATPAPVELCPYASFTGSTQDVNPDFPPMVDAMGRVYFLGDWELGNNEFRLYRVDGTTGANLEQVPGSAVTINAAEAFLGALGMSPSGDKVALSVLTDTDQYNVYVLDLNTSTATAVTSFTGAGVGGERGPHLGTLIFWSADETQLALRADWEVAGGEPEGDYSAFIIDIATTSAIRIFEPVLGGDATDLGFTADGSRLYVVGDLMADGEFELYSTTSLATPNQAPSGALAQGVASSSQSVFGLVLR